MVEDIQDPRRTEPPYVLDERAMLEGWLEFHRMTLLLKCEGLTDEQRKAHPVASSRLSLHGLIRHMTDVERGWFRRTIALEDVAYVFDYGNDDDADFAVEGADWDADLAAWQQECEGSRAIAASRHLDDEGAKRTGDPVSLRWVYHHMIEEYARHNGDADLIRELVDGAVGW